MKTSACFRLPARRHAPHTPPARTRRRRQRRPPACAAHRLLGPRACNRRRAAALQRGVRAGIAGGMRMRGERRSAEQQARVRPAARQPPKITGLFAKSPCRPLAAAAITHDLRRRPRSHARLRVSCKRRPPGGQRALFACGLPLLVLAARPPCSSRRPGCCAPSTQVATCLPSPPPMAACARSTRVRRGAVAAHTRLLGSKQPPAAAAAAPIARQPR